MSHAPAVTEAQRKATAYHEAGHGVMGCVLGRSPISVDIIPDDRGNDGHTHFPEDFPPCMKSWFDESPQKKKYLEVRVLTTLAGTAAHNLLEPNRHQDSGDQEDDRQARQMVQESMSWDDAHDAYIKQLKARAQELLTEYWAAVEAVAAELLRRNELTSQEITVIVGRSSPSRG